MIKLLVMDVDGTLTDGGLYYDNQGNEFKKFNVKDGAGIRQISEAGVQTMILTGRSSQCVERRANELKIDYLVQGVADKATYLQAFMNEQNLHPEEVAYIGDDSNDLSCMELAGNTACPSDAIEQVKRKVHRICSCKGGMGAVREFTDYILEEFF